MANVAYEIKSRQMPPKGAPQPSAVDRDAALESISRAVNASDLTGDIAADSLGARHTRLGHVQL